MEGNVNVHLLCSSNLTCIFKKKAALAINEIQGPLKCT